MKKYETKQNKLGLRFAKFRSANRQPMGWLPFKLSLDIVIMGNSLNR